MKWLICATVVLAPAMVACAEDIKKPAATQPAATKPAVKNVGVDEFAKLAADKKNVILDVRTPQEYAQGHLPGAMNIDLNGNDFTEKVAALDKTKTYLVHCAAGVRSTRACTKLSKMDFENLYNLEGGLTAWKKAGKEVEK